MGTLLSVNTGRGRASEHSDVGRTAIGKRPATGPVAVAAPGPERGTSGLAGDEICDARHHGGGDQAVYAYAREDLDAWERELGRELPAGTFGENLTLRGVDVTGARIGERWRIGAELVLEVTSPRIPCRTFAGELGEQKWVRRFTEAAVPGAYLRVLTPGQITAGDEVEVLHLPPHEVTIGLTFRALTTERELLDRLRGIDALSAAVKRKLG
ncbi:MOSC domain-containing protein [Streptacidiphilus monticola]|jgi:MOSC domain-containing protein YiiM|uniref:MOSC domain-containing protein n=1 Tax=Streptacidiphilus monticola TaxID=2161674 RepID=A0ABW1FXZ4_9ACTN